MNLFEWRTKRGMTQTEAAAKVKVDQGLWSKWERRVSAPSLEYAVKILEATGGEVTLAELAKRGPGGR